MRRVSIRITFENGYEPVRVYELVGELPKQINEEYERHLRNQLVGELEIELRWHAYYSSLPDVEGFIERTTQTYNMMEIDIGEFFDRRNTLWIWIEIGRTLREVKLLLAESMACKSLESSLSNNADEEDYLFVIHASKMEKSNLSIFYLAKIEDLVLRLLFENLGASLIPVDITKRSWEKELTWQNVKRALREKTANQALASLSDVEYGAIKRIVRQLRCSPIRRFLDYRHRLTHRVKPAVDYPKFFTHLEDRVGKATHDSQGRVIRRAWGVGGQPSKPTMTSDELYTLTVEALKRYLVLLRELKAIPRFSPEAVR